MKVYPKYKDSGVEFLGEIPDHWVVKRLKYIGESISGITYHPKDITDNSGILVLRASNIKEGKLCLQDCVKIDKKVPDKLRVRVGDILICSRSGSKSLIGKNIVIDESLQGSTFGAFMTVFRTEISLFVSKFFNSQVFNGQSGLFLTSTINQLTIGTLNNCYIALPPKMERMNIGLFLDHKTTLIDTLIEKKKRRIDLLNEERSAVINQAVTKGLDPDVKFKDSEIEWLGHIPAHWEIKKFKYFFTLITEKNKGSSDKKIALENIEPHTGRFIESDTKFEGEGIAFNDEDILFGKLRPYLAKVLAPGFKGSAVGDIYVFRPTAVVDSAFSLYRMLAKSFINVVNGATYGSRMPRASWDFIGNILIAFPSLNEQKKIVKYIRAEITRIDTIITKTQKQIQLLKEYRTALISEVVTGKMEIGRIIKKGTFS